NLRLSPNKAAYLPVLAGVGGKAALEATLTSFKNGSSEEKKAAVEALSQWSDDASLNELYEIAKSPGNSGYKDQAIQGYVASVRRASVTPEQKVILLRKVLETATSADSKKAIISELQRNKTFYSLITAGKYLDDSE